MLYYTKVADFHNFKSFVYFFIGIMKTSRVNKIFHNISFLKVAIHEIMYNCYYSSTDFPQTYSLFEILTL